MTPIRVAEVSVPCVTTSEASSQNAAPEVYYVVVPDGRPSPSSLQAIGKAERKPRGNWKSGRAVTGQVVSLYVLR